MMISYLGSWYILAGREKFVKPRCVFSIGHISLVEYPMKRSKRKGKDEYGRSDGNGFDLGLSQETKNGIWGIACLGIGIVAVLAILGMAGKAGAWFHSAAATLFGFGIFLVPLAFGMLGVAFLKSIHRKIYTSAVIGTALFVLAFLGLFHVFNKSGGYLGMVFGYPLLTYVGGTASIVILILLIFVAVLIALNVPVHKLLPWLRHDEEMEQE